MLVITLCSNTRMEYKNNSVPLKPKTEFKFNKKEFKKIIKKILSDQIFQKLKLKIFLLHKTENL